MHVRTKLLMAATLALQAIAQTQPAWAAGPFRLVVPFPAGGQVDVAARVLAASMAPALGESIVVENRTGADGLIGTEYVAKSPADGYTWLAQAVPFTVMPSLRPQQLRYDTIRDFQPVALFATASLVYVVPSSLPASTLADFVAYVKARPGQISYAGSSQGSLAHLTAEMLKHAVGISMEMIPYAGMPPAMTDLATGRTQFMSVGVSVALPYIKSGALKPLAVLDSTRHKLLPAVPTIVEQGYPALATSTWFGLLVPAKSPAEMVQKINAVAVGALRTADVAEKFEAVGIDTPKGANTPANFAALIKDEVARWGAVVRDAKIVLK